MAATIWTNDMTLMSPTLLLVSRENVSRIRHTMRNASPMFRFAAPCQVSTILWTISATWFTNTMTLSCSTSVVSVKLRRFAKPKTASTLLPAIMGFTVALSSSMFFPMISHPASPKPKASNLPSLMIAFSRIFVSKVCSFLPRRRQNLKLLTRSYNECVCFASSSTSCFSKYISSPNFMAYSGLSRISCTFEIIRSMGCNTSTLASWLKTMAPTASTAQIKAVCMML
mmetsp:Transcript_28724/g.79084  ORF Transcript_28724/g.79084 Transcript_28724/m.79084 type:complete len:227 (-) Transcript_28724:1467-2147(-)